MWSTFLHAPRVSHKTFGRHGKEASVTVGTSSAALSTESGHRTDRLSMRARAVAAVTGTDATRAQSGDISQAVQGLAGWGGSSSAEPVMVLVLSHQTQPPGPELAELGLPAARGATGPPACAPPPGAPSPRANTAARTPLHTWPPPRESPSRTPVLPVSSAGAPGPGPLWAVGSGPGRSPPPLVSPPRPRRGGHRRQRGWGATVLGPPSRA